MPRYISIFIVLLAICHGNAQETPTYPWAEKFTFTRQDSLRGGLTLQRTCYDVVHYDLAIKVDDTARTLAGSNAITFQWLEKSDSIQIDLFENMVMDSILFASTKLDFRRDGNATFVAADSLWQIDSCYTIKCHYHGRPIAAKKAPWDGGFTWSKTSEGRAWFAVSCEGIGASLWWPNKDHLSDEPDSMDMRYTVRKPLMCIGNGRLISADTSQLDVNTYHWKVSNNINNYNVTLYAAAFEHLQDSMVTLAGNTLTLDYYVLPENVSKAKKHFEQMPGILEAYEYYFAEYPYIADGFKLVEAPYLGMEHQSAIAYGNDYMRGYRGGMIPPDMDWDYILVHETGHEYFGNSVSCNDHAEMWIHESFTTYMEALYVEYQSGIEEALRYLSYFKKHGNKQPIVGPMHVNFDSWSSSDHYFKGSWILHTLRHDIYDDEVWFGLLKHLYAKFSNGQASTAEIVDCINAYTNHDYTAFFHQYLYTPDVPTLYIQKTGRHNYSIHLEDAIDAFDLKLTMGPHGEKITVSNEAQSLDYKGDIAYLADWLGQRYLIGINRIEW